MVPVKWFKNLFNWPNAITNQLLLPDQAYPASRLPLTDQDD
jgi:hypothetical protein